MLNADEEQKKAVRRLFNITDDDVAANVNKLKKWAVTQPHLPIDTQDDNLLEMFLLKAKFKEAKARAMIEDCYETMAHYHQYFSKLGCYIPSQQQGMFCPIPKLTANYERIGIMCLSPKHLPVDILDIDAMLTTTFTAGLLEFTKDYVAGVRFIFDFNGFTASLVLQLTPKIIMLLLNVYEKVMRVRLAGLEFVNCPGILDVVATLARTFLKPKLLSRLSVHADMESLHRNVPKQCLPKEYGGELESCELLIEQCDHLIEEHRPFLNSIAKFVESRKKVGINDEEIFGIQGSFKTLTVD